METASQRDIEDWDVEAWDTNSITRSRPVKREAVPEGSA